MDRNLWLNNHSSQSNIYTKHQIPNEQYPPFLFKSKGERTKKP